MFKTIRHTFAALLLCATTAGIAQEAQIRKVLPERLPNLPKIEEVNKTAIPGVYEVRVGNDIIYSDESGNHVIQGSLFETKTRTNLTEARQQKFSAIDFASLPLKDALVIKQGSGARKLAVFADPNCGFCKRFERDLVGLKDVTIYTFLYPILGPDSEEKSRAIWCSKDSMKTWRAWMLDAATPPKIAGRCDSAAVDRTLAFGRKHRVTGTPALVFEDGTRVPGAVPIADVEKQFELSSKAPAPKS